MQTSWQNPDDFPTRGRMVSFEVAAVPAGGRVRNAARQETPYRWSLLVDLGTGIGSPSWFGGLATCGALCWAAISLAPADQQHGSSVEELGPTTFFPATDRVPAAPAVATSSAVKGLATTPARSTSKLAILVPETGGLRLALRRKGLSEKEAAAASMLIQSLVPETDRPTGARLHLQLGRRISQDRARPLERLSYRSALGREVALRKAGGAWELTSTGMAVETTPLKMTGKLGAGLDGGAPAGPREPAGLRIHTSLARPVSGVVTSGFGFRRHPILGYWRMHNGLDIRAAYGTPILAAADGNVSHAGWAGSRGKEVRLAHADGLSTSYSHMSAIAVTPGDAIRRNDIIGFVGSTGLSTGSHVHFEVRKHGRPQDPALAGTWE